jgi:hypothetical protein
MGTHRGWLIRVRVVLFGGGFGFRGRVLVRQLADVMAFAGTPENQRYGGEPGKGFAKIESHKVRHSKRRALGCARGKAAKGRKGRMPNSERRISNFRGNELKGHFSGLLCAQSGATGKKQCLE